MTTDNRMNEPREAQVEAAAKALHETRNPWFAAYGDWGAAGYEIKQAFRESASAALEAAARAAQSAVPQESSRLPDFFAPKPMPNGYIPVPQEPTEAQVKLAYLAHLKAPRTRGMDVYGSMRAALVAAQGAARPVNGFDTTVERVKTGADSLHVAPQVPNQNETKSGNNFVSLDPEKVADVIGAAQVIRELGEDGRTSISFASGETIAHALCEAYTEGKLTK